MENLEAIYATIKENDLVLLLFPGTQCSVGEQVGLKIEHLAVKYPGLKIVISYKLEISSLFQVFTFPAIKLYVASRLSYEKARVFSIQELEQKIIKYKELIKKDEE